MRKPLLGLLIFAGLALGQEPLDPPASPWAQEAVELLVAKGVFIGYPDGTFRWREPLTRQEAALALYRLLAAYGLDRLSPEEVDKLLSAVKRLQEELADQGQQMAGLEEEAKALAERLKSLEGQPQADTRPLEEALRRVEERLKALEEAQKGLEAARGALEARALEEELKKVQERIKDLEDKFRALEGRSQTTPRDLEALKGEQEALKTTQKALEDRMAALEQARAAQEEALKRLEESLKGLPEARKLAEEAQARLQTLEPRVKALEEGLEGQKGRLQSLEERLRALEARQTQDEARLKALEEEVASLKRTLTPSRQPLYVGLAIYRGDVTGEWFGRLLLGHDALLGPLGLRLAYEAPFAQPSQGLASLDLTFRTSFGDLDGYFGVGGGLYLEGTPFGQLLIGAGARVVPNLSLFLEGHQRYLFDGQMGQRSTLAFGLAARF
ncbi:S-layer homology domain-containing protein [Thermus tenuipuniceus]|uniref:S-layer homology domain-containing protein n=1 Tax=Thermus tenuipuniceus TaxID=2078690 RepID=UPI000CFA3189|nr:S-layer homology domain-containing protein [Thermus tenuipuniceus]